MPSHRKSRRRIAILLVLPAFFVIWFVTAPGSMAVQRIAAGTGSGLIAHFVIRAAGLYDAPMGWFYKYPPVIGYDNFMADWWCNELDAPETTP